MGARSPDPEAAEASRNADVVAQNQRLASAADIDNAMRDLRSGNRRAARSRLQTRAEELERAAVATGSAVLLDEAEAVRELAGELDEDVDEDRARDLYLQNQARGNEVRQGVEAGEMYHLDTVH